MKVGTTDIIDCKVGSTQIKAIYQGTTPIWSSQYITNITVGETAHTTYDYHGYLHTSGIPYLFGGTVPATGSQDNAGFGTAGTLIPGQTVVGLTYQAFPAAGTPRLDLWSTADLSSTGLTMYLEGPDGAVSYALTSYTSNAVQPTGYWKMAWDSQSTNFTTMFADGQPNTGENWKVYFA